MFSSRATVGSYAWFKHVKELGMMVHTSTPSIWRIAETDVGYIATIKK